MSGSRFWLRPLSSSVLLVAFLVESAAAMADDVPVASGASTASAPITVTWTAPSGCPSDAGLQERVAKLLGGLPAASDHRLNVVGIVETTDSGYRLELTLSSETSESKRILEGPACEPLTDAGALVIALAFDPDAVAAHEQSTKTPEPAATSSASAVLPAPSAAPSSGEAPIRIPVLVAPPAAPKGEERAKVTWGGAAAFQGDLGSLPGASPGLRAGPFLEFYGFRFAPAFEALPSSKANLTSRTSVGAEFRLLLFSFLVCRRIAPVVNVAGCVGFEAGEMAATGFGVASTSTQGVFWAAPRVELMGELQLTKRVSLTAGLGVAIPLDRKRFVLDLRDGRTPIHESSVVVGRAFGGVLFRL